ncbi:MAG: hypothetical protein Q8S15_03775 [Erysipelotrichaceae bacterium]|nr:hypothetical protein [Erysipelotrichaceae bacterium]MDP3305169.1 hypothetical protein [Erysipelotrichaceae bacterium]
MSYQEKRTIVSIISGLIILSAYSLYTYGKYKSGVVIEGDLKFWAGAMLLFIAIGIVSTIIIQIVFHILLSVTIAVKAKVNNEDCDDKEIEKSIQSEMVTDEMDKLIELKSSMVGFIVAGIGFVLALLLIFLDYSAVVMINVMFASFSLGSLFEGFTQLYFYRRGIKHG